MKVLTSIGHGGANLPDIIIPGTTPIGADGGWGTVYGVGKGIEVYKGGMAAAVELAGKGNPWPAIIAKQCVIYFAQYEPSTPFMSNMAEDKLDAATIKQVAVYLRAAYRAGLNVGQYGWPTWRWQSPDVWMALNDTVARSWKPWLNMINPTCYLAGKDSTEETELMFSEVIRYAELLSESRRIAGTTEEVVPVLSDTIIGYDDGKANGKKNRQVVELLKASGIKTVIIWTDRGDGPEIRDLVEACK